MSGGRLAAGPLVALAAVVVGILAGERLGPAPAVAALVCGVVLAASALVVGARARSSVDGSRRFAAAGCVVVACGLLATGATRRGLDGLATSPLTTLTAHGSSIVAVVTLVGDPDPGRFSTRAVARVRVVTAPTRRAGGRRLVLLTASADNATRLGVLEAGDRLVVRGRIRPLEGFDRRFRWRHVVARLAVSDVTRVDAPAGAFARVANAARHAVLAGTRLLPARERGLVSGFLVGDTRGIPPDTVAEFRAAGLSHLLAVSGENVAFVLAVASPVLRRFRLRGRLVGGLTVLALFGTMTRWEPSVLRAITMTALSMAAIFVGRPVPAARVLALAATGLLLADPFLLHSVGFGLSCGACAGLVTLAPILASRLPGPEGFRLPLATTAAAQLGVLPVALATFGSLPLVALPANLAVAPVVGPLTIAGLVGGTVGGLLAGRAPGAAALCQVPARLLTGYVEAVASLAARAPLALDRRSVWLVAAVGCVVAAVVVARGRAGSVRARCPRSVSVTASTTSPPERS